MEELYGYVFWYNHYEKCWYAIPTKKYNDFFSGRFDKSKCLKSPYAYNLIDFISKSKHK